LRFVYVLLVIAQLIASVHFLDSVLYWMFTVKQPADSEQRHWQFVKRVW